jgi:hypothetical protein
MAVSFWGLANQTIFLMLFGLVKEAEVVSTSSSFYSEEIEHREPVDRPVQTRFSHNQYMRGGAARASLFLNRKTV